MDILALILLPYPALFFHRITLIDTSSLAADDPGDLWLAQGLTRVNRLSQEKPTTVSTGDEIACQTCHNWKSLVSYHKTSEVCGCSGDKQPADWSSNWESVCMSFFVFTYLSLLPCLFFSTSFWLFIFFMWLSFLPISVFSFGISVSLSFLHSEFLFFTVSLFVYISVSCFAYLFLHFFQSVYSSLFLSVKPSFFLPSLSLLPSSGRSETKGKKESQIRVQRQLDTQNDWNRNKDRDRHSRPDVWLPLCPAPPQHPHIKTNPDPPLGQQREKRVHSEAHKGSDVREGTGLHYSDMMPFTGNHLWANTPKRILLTVTSFTVMMMKCLVNCQVGCECKPPSEILPVLHFFYFYSYFV